MSKTQSWIENADPELFGHNGDKGMIRLFYDDRIQRITREEEHQRFMKRMALLIAAIAAVPGVIEIVKLFH